MALTPGTRLGPYEILAPLGAGGMGEVYRGRDMRLGRDVAIKVLPDRLALDPALRQRFEREARAISSLNHPHICTVHDVGHQDGTDYLVMELLEGETLLERLKKGALPLDHALRYGIEVADALDKAHRQGVIHRDLKPGNVMLTRTGAKLLDFGLAKRKTEPPLPVDTSSPTRTRDLTGAKTLLGTLPYMAPEQVEGKKEADARTDIWALGLLLYEMATGKRAFEGESQASLIGAILKDEPVSITTIQPLTPPALDRAVRTCLAKDPDERWQSAHDLMTELRWTSQAGSQDAAVRGPTTVRRRNRERFVWVVTLFAAFVAAGISQRFARREGERAGRESAFQGLSFQQMSFHRQAIFRAAFAPDGETIVYSSALEGNQPELFTIRPEYPEPRPLGLPRTHLLSISSKGELAVLTNARPVVQRLFRGTLARLALGGTAPRELLEDVRQADWSADGSELAIIREVGGQDRLEYPIGKVLYQSNGYLSDLRVSPRGDRIALFEHPFKWDDRGSVIAVDRAGNQAVLSAGYAAEEGLAWSTAGDEVLFSATIAGNSLTLFGVDLTGRKRVVLNSPGGITIHDVSRRGRCLVTRDNTVVRIMARAPGSQEERDLSWLDFSFSPHLSSDGQLLLFSESGAPAGGTYAVCLRRTDGGPVVRLGEGEARGLSPDGKWALAFIHATPPQAVIYPTGPGEARHLPRGDLEDYDYGTWFPDGRHVLLCGHEPRRKSRCYEQDTSGGPPSAVTPEGTRLGQVSPDGQRILVMGTGGREIYSMAGGPPVTVPALSDEDRVVRWGVDGGSLLVYRASELPVRLERLFLDSGRREFIREIGAPHGVGPGKIWNVTIADDGQSYGYAFMAMTSELFVLEGAR